MGEGSWGADSPPPSPHSTNQDPRERERSEGFFLWSRLLINAISNETRLVPGVLSTGGGGCLLMGDPRPCLCQAPAAFHPPAQKQVPAGSSRAIRPPIPVGWGGWGCGNPSPGSLLLSGQGCSCPEGGLDLESWHLALSRARHGIGAAEITGRAAPFPCI